MSKSSSAELSLTRSLGADARRRIVLRVVAALAVLLAVTAVRPPPLDQLRLAGADLMQGLGPAGSPAPAPVVVTIGEPSLAAVGPWPWPHARLAALLDRVAAGDPVAVAVAILLDAPDRLGPEALRRDSELEPALAAALALGPSADGEAALARALAAAPSALATTLVPEGVAGSPRDPFAVGVIGGGVLDPDFGAVAAARAELAAAAAAEGAVNLLPHRDMLLRRMPLAFAVNGVVHPALATAALAAAGLAPSIVLSEGGVRALDVLGRRIKTDPDGAVWLDFRRRAEPERIEAAALLDGAVDPSRLAGRFVVVGVEAAGLSMMLRAADGSLIGTAEAHALLIDALVSARALRRPDWADMAELAALAVAGLLLAALWAGRSPGVAVLSALAAGAGLIGAAVGARAACGVVLDPATPVFALLCLTAAGAAARTVETDRRRAALIDELARRGDEARRAERARSAFLAEMTHDFRTPINAIHGAARQISAEARRGDLAGVLENVHLIEQLGDHLRMLARRAVSAARLDGADPPLDEEETALSPLLLDARRLALLAADPLHRDVAIEVAGSGVIVRGDPLFLLEAAISLTSNAVAYAGLDGPVLCRDGVSELGEPFVEVIDRGPGLSEDVRLAAEGPLLERGLLSAVRGPYGLGLFVAKSVAERHGGRLELRQGGEGGLTARLVLPGSRLVVG